MCAPGRDREDRGRMRSRLPSDRETVAARAAPPHVSPTTLPEAFAHLQHAAGNRAVAGMVARAGVPAGQAPPGGLNAVQARSAGAAGYTGVKNSGAFVNVDLTTSIDRSSSKPGEAYVTADPPQDSPDAVHEALYLLPGDHRHGTGTYTDKGRTYTPYTRVDEDTSTLIRAGEQEHLDDARRAYDLSYGLILATLRAMAGRRFGPAATPSAAEALARTEFDKQLPPALSVSRPGYRSAWIAVLDALLKQTKARDKNGWHDLLDGRMVTEGNKWVYPLERTGTTKIGSVGSDQVVNYPPAPP
jgi:hypothetical protein